MVRLWGKVLLACLLVLLAVPLWAQTGSSYVLSADQRDYRIINRYEVANVSKLVLENVKVRVLIGAESTSPYQANVSFRMTPPGVTRARDYNGNLYGDLTFATMKPGEKRTITVEKTVRNSGVSVLSIIYTLFPDYNAFYANRMNYVYVQPATQIESEDLAIQELAAQFMHIDAPAKRAKAIFDYVNTTIDYNPNPPYANAGALSAARTGQGVCTEFSGLFVALARATGIPARVVSGYWQTEPFPAGRAIEEKPYRHAWAEFYLPDVGWIPVEPSISVTMGDARMPSTKSFARIGAEERHFIWAYGLEAEREGNVSISYEYQLQKNTPKPKQAQLVRATLAYEAFEEL